MEENATLPVQSVERSFGVLHKNIKEAGLFERQPLYYILQIGWCFGLLAAGFAVLGITQHPGIVLLDAVFLGFAMGQMGFLGHDSGHCQIFTTHRANMILSQIGTFCTGVSRMYWVQKHNEHHAHPNHEEADPDIDYIILAFTEKQAAKATGLVRFIISHQRLFFFPVVSLAFFSLRMGSVLHFLRLPLSKIWLDALVFTLHFVVYVLLVFSLLPVSLGIAFIIIHQCAWGMYIGSVFAPNHKGMPIIERGKEPGFLQEQVTTSRNVRGSFLTDILYGGLNYQIEHHLFPHMPRKHLRKASALVREHCQNVGIPYHETGIIQSYKEILAYMESVAIEARDNVSPRAQDSLKARLSALCGCAKAEVDAFRASICSGPSLHPEEIDRSVAFANAVVAKLETMQGSITRSVRIKKEAAARMQREAADLLQQCKTRLQSHVPTRA